MSSRRNQRRPACSTQGMRPRLARWWTLVGVTPNKAAASPARSHTCSLSGGEPRSRSACARATVLSRFACCCARHSPATALTDSASRDGKRRATWRRTTRPDRARVLTVDGEQRIISAATSCETHSVSCSMLTRTSRVDRRTACRPRRTGSRPASCGCHPRRRGRTAPTLQQV
jgi:hypothetical protein